MKEKRISRAEIEDLAPKLAEAIKEVLETAEAKDEESEES